MRAYDSYFDDEPRRRPMRRYGGCDCGAMDCPDCGPAQGYAVIRKYYPGRGWVYENPEDHIDEWVQ